MNNGFWIHEHVASLGSFTHRLFYTEAFTHRTFYTGKPLHGAARTHTQKHLHSEAFTHRSFDKGQHLQRGLLHTDALTQSSFTHLRQVDREKLIEMTVMRGRMREDGGRRRRRRRMRIAGMIPEKNLRFLGKNLRPWKKYNFIGKTISGFPWSSGPLVLWSLGPLVPWSLVLLIP